MTAPTPTPNNLRKLLHALVSAPWREARSHRIPTLHELRALHLEGFRRNLEDSEQRLRDLETDA